MKNKELYDVENVEREGLKIILTFEEEWQLRNFLKWLEEED